jgi:hypothetical protein
VIQSSNNSRLHLSCKKRETKPELYLLLISLNISVNVDEVRMNILKRGTYGMMFDVVASGAVKFTGNNSVFVLYVIRCRTNNYTAAVSRLFYLHRIWNLSTVQETKRVCPFRCS